MFKKMLALALLLPALGGCIWGGGHRSHGNKHNGHSGGSVQSAHVHAGGCGHVLRGGVWIGGN